MLTDTEMTLLNAIRERQSERATASGNMADVDFLLTVVHKFSVTLAFREKVRQTIEDFFLLKDEDLARVLGRMPYKVGSTWMVCEPAPGLSEKAGRPCFEAKVIE